MKPYFVALALGIVVGIIYALCSVRSPAPPIIALVGLLGILAGEQLPSLAMRMFQRGPSATSWMQHQVTPHMFGQLPRSAGDETKVDSSPALTVKKRT